MKLNSYLMFDGNCETALKFYAKVLGGKVEAMMPYGDTPACEHVPASHRDKIMHGRIVIGDQVLMGTDTTPDHPYEGVKGCSISLQASDVAEAERVFAALSENATIQMPLGETFWAERFGMLIDQYGVPWMINCDKQP
jgi:PhnB protein